MLFGIKFKVEDHFDKDDELEFTMLEEDEHWVWLSRKEVIRLRDHLNSVLGVAT